jgi:hypothetical protein
MTTRRTRRPGFYSRRNVRVLTSVDYAAMSAEDKAKEQYPPRPATTR